MASVQAEVEAAIQTAITGCVDDCSGDVRLVTEAADCVDGAEVAVTWTLPTDPPPPMVTVARQDNIVCDRNCQGTVTCPTGYVAMGGALETTGSLDDGTRLEIRTFPPTADMTGWVFSARSNGGNNVWPGSFIVTCLQAMVAMP